MNELKHRQALLDFEASSELERQKREHQQKAELHRQLASAKSEGLRVRCAILHENGVDLTKYLIATAIGQQKAGGKPKYMKQLHRTKDGVGEKTEEVGDSWVIQNESEWDQGSHWVLDS